jgi:hypothetical protein
MPPNNRFDSLQRAERAFAVRTQQKADAPQATVEYRAAEQALRDRTAKLRQARLAREAAAAGKPKE